MPLHISETGYGPFVYETMEETGVLRDARNMCCTFIMAIRIYTYVVYKDKDKDKDTFIGPQEFVVHMTI